MVCLHDSCGIPCALHLLCNCWYPPRAATAGELYNQIRLSKRLPLAHAQFYAAEVVLMLEYLQVAPSACYCGYENLHCHRIPTNACIPCCCSSTGCCL